jgi:hypothetical protein
MVKGLKENDYQKAKGRGGGGKPAMADQKHLNAKAFVADIAAKVENNRWESVGKIVQAHGM